MAGLFAGILGALKGVGGSLLGGLANGIGSLFGNSNVMGGLLSMFNQKRQFGYQMQLQDDAQAFNAEQAEINRNFNARQAEIARDWQESFYNKYQSPSAMMAQYRDAGINPMLVAGQGAGSPPSASSASGSPASSGLGSAPSGSLVADIIQMMMIKAQIKEVESRTRLNNSQADKTNVEVEFSPALFRMQLEQGKVGIQNTLAGIRKIESDISYINQQIKESNSRISLNEAQQGLLILQQSLTKAQTKESVSRTSLNYSNIGVNNANVAYINEQTLREYWETRYREEYNTEPSPGLYTFIKELIMRANGSMRRVGNDDRFLRNK